MSSSRSASPSEKLEEQQTPSGSPSLRRLLPANPDSERLESVGRSTPTSSNSNSQSAPPTFDSSSLRKRRRQATTAACGACRKRKSKCDGQRPECSVCRHRKTACEFDTIAASETHTQALKRKYTELQAQKTALEEIFDVLQKRPEKEAEEIFQRIRSGADARSILRHVNHGDLLVQLALVPEARFRYEFPYLPGMPSFLSTHENPYLDSEIYDCALRGDSDSVQQRQDHQQPRRQRLLPGIASLINPTQGLEVKDQYYKPYSTAMVVHPLLDSLRPSRWTTVSDDDDLMRKLIHDYLLHEYEWFTCFHKDYFLEDMANERRRFCSSLLVNVVLCLGCFCHQGLRGSAEPWNLKYIGNQFLAEARRLLEIEYELAPPPQYPGDLDSDRRYSNWEQRRLTTIQASCLLTVVYNLNGSDKIGWKYTVRAVEMAHEIQLYGPLREGDGNDLSCVRTYTAWAVFNWQSLSSYHYLKMPLLADVPAVPLPDPREHPQWYGELWMRYPLAREPVPTHHGLLFKAKAEFYAIMNEFSHLSFSPNSGKLSPYQLIGFYHRLLIWNRGLPPPLTARRIVFPSQLKLHMHYNLMLADLLKPLVGHHWIDEIRPGKTIDESHSEAMKHFETLVRLYYLRHGFDSFDAFLIHFLGCLAFIAISSVEQQTDPLTLESRRSTVLLLLKGMHDQGLCHHVAKAVLRLYVTFLRPEDLELLKRFVDIKAEQLVYGPLEDTTILTDWPVYDVGFEEKVEKQRKGKNLATIIASLSLGSSTPQNSRRTAA
ncbi:putative nitrogen assimilation transcription factor [Podospora australis]|uniref:Nitrogen assimilation transcription factor n=1 Tax=Podospora australis TaxID=1536484 RepID=A0AAN7AM39_9PEZI|nr:putative nitrogen assimilation transcription factor [Podospora australis]